MEQVSATLTETGFDPRLLRLEITESMAMAEAERAVRILAELKQLGVHISVDDFGTGFSSLSYLHKLPVDTLKIDRSFVSGMEHGGVEIVGTIMALARSLRMEVVAEGIETDEQAAHLRSLGCEFGQGYLFSRPLEAVAARALLGPRLEARAA